MPNSFDMYKNTLYNTTNELNKADKTDLNKHTTEEHSA